MVSLGVRGCSPIKIIAILKFKSRRTRHSCLVSPAVMPHLPKRLAPVRSAVASLLYHYCHIGNLYSAGNIANALNNAADVDGDNAINSSVDTTLLVRAFANEGAHEYDLRYSNVLSRDGWTRMTGRGLFGI